VIEKEQVVAPKFVERFTTVHVKEGEPVVLNARAVGTPIPRITWQKVTAAVTYLLYMFYRGYICPFKLNKCAVQIM
jgi:hypothetical protein